MNPAHEVKLHEDLGKNLKCEVRFDPATKAVYSTDASNYRHVPLAVAFPKTAEDIIRVVEICRRHGAPIVSRGGGTSLAGQGCNEAVMLDYSKYYCAILELDAEKQFARVQPGIVLDDLRNEAKKKGLTFGPDPATHNRCTLGGMMGNNSCGAHSVMAGKTVDNVVELDILTYAGERFTVGETPPHDLAAIIRAGGAKGEIYRRLHELSHRIEARVREKYPKIPRRVSGYNLDSLLEENHFNVAKALIGSEGTCVIILEAKLRLIPEPKVRSLVAIGFTDIFEAAGAAPELLKLKPIALEAVDEDLANHMRTKNLHVDDLKKMPEGKSWLFFEIGADTETEASHHAERVARFVPKLDGFKGVKVFLQPEIQKKIWEVRESGLGASAFVPGERDTWEGWEDSAVSPEVLKDYLKALKKLYEKYNYEGVLYGHFGDGCVHTRTTYDLISAEGVRNFRNFLGEAADLVVRFGGSISGEHGDGQSKANLLPQMFGAEIIEAFREFKGIWDPLGKMNPGRVVDAIAPTDHLRLGASYKPHVPKTHFAFAEDGGGFDRAALRCVGVGQCRNTQTGIMCPSYRVTREEKHSTRGRARLLFEMLRGEVVRDGWNSREVKESLDLCLACKGCKGECPVNVDMATYKAEFLSHFYRKHLRPLTAFSMGQIKIVSRIANLFPWLVNDLLAFPPIRWLAKLLGGIHPKREFPRFADRSFRRTAKKMFDQTPDGRPVVMLWVDTFTNSFHPEVAQSALNALRSSGLQVLLPKKNYCCGRPLYDFGFLDQAKRYLKKILVENEKIIRDGIPFIFLEPSCASVFRDELLNLFPRDMDARRLSKQTFMLSEYLVRYRLDFEWPQFSGKALVQAHCHHKSVIKFDDEESALKKMGLDVEVMDSGCCGMAGSFGFEKKHYDVSQAVGNLVLFGKLRERDTETLVIADGFSCQQQIRQSTGTATYHIAQLLDPACAVPGRITL